MDYDYWKSTGTCYCPICGKKFREAGCSDGTELTCSDKCTKEMEAAMGPFQCPSCGGSPEGYAVRAEMYVNLYYVDGQEPDGYDDCYDGPRYNEDSIIKCLSCNHHGLVCDFRVGDTK